MKNNFAILFLCLFLASCAPHLKPVVIYENPRLKKDVILYNNNKMLLLHNKGQHEYEFGLGHYSIEDSAVQFRNELTTTMFSFKFTDEEDTVITGCTIAISFDFLQGEKKNIGTMDGYFMINDTMRVNMKLDSVRTGMMYGIYDSELKSVRDIQFFEVRSCFSTQRYTVKDSTHNRVILHMKYIPETGPYNDYIWGAMRTAVISPTGDSMLLNMSSCGTPSARTDTLFKVADMKKYKKWPVEALPAYLQQDLRKMDN